MGGGFKEDPDSSWGGDDDLFSEGADEGADWRTVLLKDVKLDRTIECFVDREIEVDGKQYATLLPADTPVIMAGYKLVNGSQQLVPVLEDKAIDELFPTAFAVLSEMDLTLSRSAVVLTVKTTTDMARKIARPRSSEARMHALHAVFLSRQCVFCRWRRMKEACRSQTQRMMTKTRITTTISCLR